MPKDILKEIYDRSARDKEKIFTKIEQKALNLMEEENPNCYSCIYHNGTCTKFSSNREATTECVEDNYSYWEANFDYFVSAVVFNND